MDELTQLILQANEGVDTLFENQDQFRYPVDDQHNDSNLSILKTQKDEPIKSSRPITKDPFKKALEKEPKRYSFQSEEDED